MRGMINGEWHVDLAQASSWKDEIAASFQTYPFRKSHPDRIRMSGQNRRIMKSDVLVSRWVKKLKQ
jgi:hypothetical protein